MYVSERFKETDPERLAALIQSYPFGSLITAPDGVPFVSHLPFLLESNHGSAGRLIGHMARANPQWQHLSSSGQALAVFQGPHAYVSPSWYSSPGVPTWNYAVAHVRGIPKLIEGEAELEEIVTRLTVTYEAPRADPWKPELSSQQRSNLPRAIVGFEIEITEIQGKFKLSQNRPQVDRLRVIEELSQSSDQTEAATGKLMAELARREARLPRRKPNRA